MDRVFFEELCIPNPDYHLGIGSDSPGAQTIFIVANAPGKMLIAIEKVLLKEKPDLIRGEGRGVRGKSLTTDP